MNSAHGDAPIQVFSVKIFITVNNLQVHVRPLSTCKIVDGAATADRACGQEKDSERATSAGYAPHSLLFRGPEGRVRPCPRMRCLGKRGAGNTHLQSSAGLL